MDTYITLASNSKGFDTNTNSNFVVKLRKSIQLSNGKTEIGLTSINFPVSWHNITKGEQRIVIFYKVNNTTKQENIIFREGRYLTINELIEELHRAIKSSKRQEEIKFFHDNIRNTTFMSIKADIEVKLSLAVSEILGFKSDKSYKTGNHQSSNWPDINRGFSSLWVYCNLAESRPVVDTIAPLLRVVPINTEKMSSQRYYASSSEFTNIQYIPTSTFNSDLIEIDIRGDNGSNIPFTSGKVDLQVHIIEIKS